MAFLNKVMFIGRLIDNPEAPRVLQNSGSTVVKFRFAVGRSKKNPETGQWENDPNPLYVDCEAFSRADNPRLTDVISRFCTKGSQIYVEGRLQLDQWDDKASGQKRSKHKVVVEQIQLLDKAQGEGGYGGGGGSRPAARPAPAYSGNSYSASSDDMDDGPPPSSGGGGSGDDNIPF